MHADRRRAGRAIRKERRLAREAAAEIDWSRFDALLKRVGGALVEAFEAMGEVLARVGKQIVDFVDAALHTPLPQQQLALPPGRTLLAIEGPRLGDPTHSGGQALS